MLAPDLVELGLRFRPGRLGAVEFEVLFDGINLALLEVMLERSERPERWWATAERWTARLAGRWLRGRLPLLSRMASAGGEAPSYICWGHNNRSAMIRVPMYKPNKGQSTRIELRTIDPACNPYLAFAVILAAGMKGIEEGYELPREAEDDVWSLTDTERRAAGYEDLPVSLGEALTAMQGSELVAETLGEHVFEFFLRNKWEEFNSYRRNVTPFELQRYLPGL